MKTYLIIATYKDSGQRYATEVNAESPEAAERDAQIIAAIDNGEIEDESEYSADHESLDIAGVICGRTDEETKALEVAA